MLFCPRCQQLEPTTSERNADGSVTHLCKKCGSAIPLRRDLTPGEVVAGFEIEEELGRGAMGIVYQARQTNLDREVAIKILSDDSASDEVYVERFFREARAAASLSHPNVVQAYDAGVTDDGIYYFVMEKVTGENLDLVLNNVGPLNIPQALDVFLSVSNALAYAWKRNQLSHGDIKPENIIMRLNGKVKIADFGLARRAKDPELADEDIRATPAYAPPEIIRGDKDVPGFKSDMYSFGATAYHILTGHEPFVGTDPAKVCAMQLSDVQVPLSEINPKIPRRLSDLVDALMEKDPENRPATWDDVVAELRDIRRELDEAVAAAASAPEGKWKKARRNGPARPPRKSSATAVVAASAVLLAVAAIVAVFCAKSCRGGGEADSGSQAKTASSSSASNSRKGNAPVRDEDYFLARWQSLLDDAGGSGPDLEVVEKFISEAGSLAPEDALKKRDSLRGERNQSRALVIRNKLLDDAAGFTPEKAKDMDAEQLDELFHSVRSDYEELMRLDDELSDHIFLDIQRKTIEEYLENISTIQLSKTLGGKIDIPVRQSNPEPGPADPETVDEPDEPEADTPEESDGPEEIAPRTDAAPRTNRGSSRTRQSRRESANRGSRRP